MGRLMPKRLSMPKRQRAASSIVSNPAATTKQFRWRSTMTYAGWRRLSRRLQKALALKSWRIAPTTTLCFFILFRSALKACHALSSMAGTVELPTVTGWGFVVSIIILWMVASMLSFSAFSALRFSTVASQDFRQLSSEGLHPPASRQRAVAMTSSCFMSLLNWRGVHIPEYPLIS